MGTAPDDRHATPVPDPDQVVTDTVAVLVAQGYPLTVALTMVADVAARAAIMAGRARMGNVSWLLAVGGSARSRLESLPPSTDDHSGEDHADGSSSRPGGRD